ncbi:hypothetical protein pb186bvf_016260 [Paramecium bursaria]
MACFIIFLFHCFSSKLIASNTLFGINHVNIQEQNINLTVWIQIRYQVFEALEEELLFEFFRIVDEQNNIHVSISLALINHVKLGLFFNLQDVSQSKDYVENKVNSWQKITIQRNICFNKLVYKDLILKSKCDEQFKASLFIFQQIIIHLFVYDTVELVNEEIILSKIFLKYYDFSINTYKNDLVIKLYSRYFLNLYFIDTFFYYRFSDNLVLLIRSFSNTIDFVMRQEQDEQLLFKKVDFDQWMLFSIEFKQLEIIIYYYINNQLDQLNIQLDHYLTFSDIQMLEYQYTTILYLTNSETISFDYVQIISKITGKDSHPCGLECQFCLNQQCYNQNPQKSIEFNIKNSIKESSYYNPNYFLNYSNECDQEKYYYFQNGTCLEWPKYRGEYCYNCHILKKIKYQNHISYLSLSISMNYEYFMDNLKLSINQDSNNGLYLEKDLNLFVIRLKDIFLSYIAIDKRYCEIGYSFQGVCKKMRKKYQLQFEDNKICSLEYALLNNKCIRCSKNCLYCQLVKKHLRCILSIDNYYQNSQGLIKQCNNNSQLIFDCLTQEEAIQTLRQRGYEVCQHHQTYDVQQFKCVDLIIFVDFDFLQYFPSFIQVVDKKSEIQYLLEDKIIQSDKQLQILISIQQLKKMQDKIKQLYLHQSILKMNRNFETLSYQQTFEDISNKKITLYGIQIFLDTVPYIYYMNREYFDLIHIYQDLQYRFTIVQFDITFILCENIYDKKYFFEIDCESMNATFILNITFNLNLSILIRSSNKFIFQAHKIIINNLIFDQGDYPRELCSDIPFITILSDEVIIKNLTIQNYNLRNLFSINDFKIFILQNVWIIDSHVDNLLSINSKEYYRNLVISDVYMIGSEFFDFLKINTGNISLYNFYYYDVRFDYTHIQIFGSLYLINVSNFYMNYVRFQNSSLIHLMQKYHSDISICFLTNIYIYKARSFDSQLFVIDHLQQLLIQGIYINGIVLQKNSTFMQLTNKNIFAKNIIINESSLSEFSVLFDFQPQVKLQIMEFLITQLTATNSFNLIQLKSKTIIVLNLILKHFWLKQVSLLNFQANRIQLTYLLFNNFYNMESYLSMIRLNSTTLNIKRMYFYYQKMINSQLITIECHGLYLIYNLSLSNFIVANEQQEQLILINSIYDINMFQWTFINDINITSKIIFYLFRMRYEGKMIIYSWHIKQMINLLPQIQIVIFDNQLSELNMKILKIHNLQNIHFLISKSQFLTIQLCNISNILMDNLIQFIYHNTSIISKEFILIRHINVLQFTGPFIAIMSSGEIYAVLDNITFTNYFNYQTFFFFGHTDISILTINNLKIINGRQDARTQGFSFFINTNFHQLFINNLYLKNTSLQLLEIEFYSEIFITNLYIDQMISQDSFLRVQSRFYMQRLAFINITITNSVFDKNWIMEIFLMGNQLILENWMMINLVVDKADFYLQSPINNSYIQISNIILQNVTSNQFLFFNSIQKIDYLRTTIIGVQSPNIFGGETNINYKLGLVTNIQKYCVFSEESMIIKQSEIVDSNIRQKENLLEIQNSQFLGKFNQQHQMIMIHLSLNNGHSLFKYQVIKENIYQVQFSINDNYLYLPSGRCLRDYKYFNHTAGSYEKLYDSFSIVSLYKTQQLKCILKQNLNQETIYVEDLMIQPGVNRIDNLSITLNPLLKDKHIQLDLICDQNKLLVTYRVLIKTLNCQLGEFLFKNQCLLCNTEQQLYSVGYNQQYCMHIDTNSMAKLDVGQIKLYQQFWRHSYANKYIEQCKNENCLGGWIPGDNSCKIGYIGALCSECDVYNIRGDGHFGRTNNQCSLCYFDYQIYLKGLILFMLQALLIYVSYYQNQQLSNQYLLLKISKRNFIEILIRQSVNQVTILLKLYYNYLFTLYLLKDITNFGNIIDFSLNIVYNPSFIAVAQFDCLINKLVQFPIQYTQLLLKIIFPLSIINLIVIAYIILIKFKYLKYTINIILLLLVVVHQQNQQIILQSLIKLSSRVKYSNIYWTLENLNIQYFSQNHQYYLFTLIIPLIIIFVIVNFVIFIWIRIVNQRIFNHLRLSIFIYRQYKSQFYYWEHMRVTYIHLFMSIFYIFDSNFLILLTIAFNLITSMQKPFNLRNCNQIDSIIYQLSLNTYFAIIYQNNDTIQMIIIVCSNLILLKLYIKYFQHSFNIQFRDQKIKYLSQLIKFTPFFKNQKNLYDKNKYYFGVLKQGRKKSNNSITAIGKSAESKQSVNMSFELEMSQIQMKL